jgi:anti-anti-sigma factor
LPPRLRASNSEVEVQRPHVVSFSGELDIWKESDVEAKLAAFDGSCAAVIDLAAVRYLDSAFLSALVRLRRRLPDCSRLYRCSIGDRSYRLAEFSSLKEQVYP